MSEEGNPVFLEERRDVQELCEVTAVLKQAEEKGEVIPATDDLPKTFLVSTEYGMNKVYLIKFNSTVLEHRRIQ